MLDNKFEPSSFEDEIYTSWEEGGYFKPNKPSNPSYTIVMPPPNITGVLHMGHAIDNTLQDILIRYKRMNGFNTLWVPGTDHAAIATEAKIVERLKTEGKTKEMLGRDKFLEYAWDWKNEFGSTINRQLRKIGASCDWSRERFTMDEGLSNAVQTVFINLYNKGLIYRGKRMINWCPYCKTSISDAEVEFEEEPSHIWHIRYTGEEGDIVVATTRPETMLGDTAIAVNPNDKKYTHMIGKYVTVPIVNRKIPIIADEFVELGFGTGAVKITPAHDPNDYNAGLKHNLEILEVFDENNKMLNLVPKFKGLDTLEARKLIVEELSEIGALVKVEDYVHNVGKCYRCHKSVEPRISEQWFVKMKPLAEPAIKVVREGEIKFVPARFSKTYFNWMENIQDWCISRQLWWGHRIPAYYCQDCGEIIVSTEKPAHCSKCGKSNFKQDEDTLDTWFSSALWPFSTLGFPENTEDLKRFFPTNTLITGYDIIFFWVARMIFSSLEHTGKIPFDTVIIHGLVRDAQGRKMSKSLGNGIDPIKVVDTYGADALRFALIQGTAMGNDSRFSDEKLESSKNFANKIWNASKFVLMNLENKNIDINFNNLCVEDKWILNKLNNIVKSYHDDFEKYDFAGALDKIYTFMWDEFCDWYIEMSKPRLYETSSQTKQNAQAVLSHVLKTSLKLLHPFMPYITEKIFNEMDSEKLIISQMPTFDDKLNFSTEEDVVEKLKEIIVSIRNARTKMNIHPAKKCNIIFKPSKFDNIIINAQSFLLKLGFGDKIIIGNEVAGCTTIIASNLTAYLPLNDLIDKEAELLRLKNEENKLNEEFTKLNSMLSNENFLTKAPKEKVEQIQTRVKELQYMLETLKEKQNSLRK